MYGGGSVEPARRRRGWVGGWRAEMIDVQFEIANPDRAGPITSLSSLDVSSEFDSDRNVDIREPTVVPPVPVCGHLRGTAVVACRLVQGTLWHRGRPTARTLGADFLFPWTVPRDNRQLTCSGEPGAPARATGAREGSDDSPLGAET
jgi:hypothetical protein